MNLLLNMNYFDQYTAAFTIALAEYAPRLIAAVFMLFIGIWSIKFFNNVARKIMVKREIEPTLIEFLTDTIHWGLRGLLLVTVISKLGVESSSFVAILGAAGLAVGLSLQGSLSNFAGGVLIILFKPFKLGDTIEAQTAMGKVIDIQIFVTQILTSNNQVIFVPNGILSNGKIINYSKMENRRTDITISISYDADLKQAKQKLETILKENTKILPEPKATVTVKELADTGVKLAVRAWTKNKDFNAVCNEILEDFQFEK
jgi:small conductance mechanosensitive channel